MESDHVVVVKVFSTIHSRPRDNKQVVSIEHCIWILESD